MTPHQRQVIDYFDQTHDDYRRLWGVDRHLGLHCGYFDAGHCRHDEAVAHMNRVLAEAAAIRRTDRVLDAGCGIGGSALWLAAHVGCRVTGITLSARQVEQARQLARRHSVEPLVDFHVADYADTGLPAASFDVVWALESLCHGEDKRAVLCEAHRLLRPGGRLVVADCFLAREALTPAEQRLVAGWQRGWLIPNVAGVGRFQEWLKQAGFQDIRFRDSTRNIAPSSWRIYLLTLLFGPPACLLHVLGLRTPVQTRGILSGYYQYHARRRGLGLYGIFTATR
jgi:cyclopropane fatty-acyl-phospholipid synthase-like methyltransferase